MGIRRRLKTAVQNNLFREETEQMKQVLALADNIYREGKYSLPTDQLLNQLKESDAYADLVQRLQLSEFELFNSNAFAYDRGQALRLARYMSATDQNVQAAIEIWTDFSLGNGVIVESDEYPVVDEVFTSSENEDLLAPQNIHELSTSALNEGELAFAYWYNPATVNETGISIRSIPTDQIEIIWLDVADETRPLWYKRSLKDGKAVYYPDWRATKAELETKPPPKNAQRTDRMSEVNPSANGRILIGGEEAETLVAVMSWARINRLADGRGLPRFSIAFEWATVLTNFMGDRAAVSKKAAMYTENVTISGGSRAIKDAVARLQSSLATGGTGYNSIYDQNPPSAAGSDWLQNDSVNREWQSRDTGAANAAQDGEMLAGQLGLTTGLPLHYAGFPGAIPGGLATARELLKPWMAKIERYQLWMSGIFKTMAIVITNISEGRVLTDKKRIQIKETDIAISLLSPILTEVDQLLNTMKTVSTAMKDGTLDPIMGALALETTLILVMTKLGVPDYEAKLKEVEEETAVDALALEDPAPTDDIPPEEEEPETEEETAVAAELIAELNQIADSLNNGEVSIENVASFLVNTFGNER